MLQIATGRLFRRDVARTNVLRGVLYSNLRVRDERIDTQAGTLLASDSQTQPASIIFEFTERIEKHPSGKDILVSHTLAPYILDFSVLLSFALNVVCSPDPAVVQRLTSGHRGVSVPGAPSRFLRRTFDNEIWMQPNDGTQLQDLIAHLLSLERRAFQAAMAAVRAYVNAVHRIGDDLGLAYTLMVAAVESLVPALDDKEASWNDYPEDKRRLIDAALNDATADTTERVHRAVLSLEHRSMSRRFRDFALGRVDATFFGADAGASIAPIGKSDLADALRQAYALRSGYVHGSRELPDEITHVRPEADWTLVGRTPTLTLAGMSRLARYVIRSFILSHRPVPPEPRDYTTELAGVIQVRLDPQYWIAATEGLDAHAGHRRWEGMLSQISDLLESNKPVTDLSPMLDKVVPQLDQFSTKDRLPYLAMIYVFSLWFVRDRKATWFDPLRARFDAEIEAPSPESLFSHVLLKCPIDWPLDAHRSVLERYLKQRTAKHGFRAPTLLEAAVTLHLAERQRLAGDASGAHLRVQEALANAPGIARLRTFAETHSDGSIDWESILLPPTPSATV